MNDFIGDEVPVLSFKKCPAGGEGVHKWLMHAAFQCLNAGLPATETCDKIRKRMTRPENAPDEVSNTVKEAQRRIGLGVTSDFETRIPWPERNEKAVAGLLRTPLPPPVAGVAATSAIETLFPGNPFLCVVARRDAKPQSVPLSDYEGLENAQLLVPSPMLGARGRVKNKAYLSARGIHNVGRRKYLVIECDFQPVDKELCLAVLRTLGTKRPLLCVVDSGGKSLHGWFAVDPSEDDDGGNLLGFMQLAVSLGADTATWRKNQYVRVPGGLRMPGSVRQEIIYWNSERIEKWSKML